MRNGAILGGRPLLYFHGWPGARVEGRLGGEAAGARGVRLIALDRPGMGLSDYQPRRTLVDWPDDVTQLAAALGLERFAVLGISGRGPVRRCLCLEAAGAAYRVPAS
jgi:pimeloyl-ACP methyl ester carboxylesterase